PGARPPPPGGAAGWATRGRRRRIPRGLDHTTSGWAIANNANIGPGAAAEYMHILGIYPDFDGATCTFQPLNSSNANCAWSASDGGPFYVHEAGNFGEPNGDNTTNGSMGYSWDVNGNVTDYNDLVVGYSSQYYMCDTGDKWP